MLLALCLVSIWIAIPQGRLDRWHVIFAQTANHSPTEFWVGHSIEWVRYGRRDVDGHDQAILKQRLALRVGKVADRERECVAFPGRELLIDGHAPSLGGRIATDCVACVEGGHGDGDGASIENRIADIHGT